MADDPFDRLTALLKKIKENPPAKEQAARVLLAVVGGTTVSVIGIFLVVANYLFPKK